MLVDSGVLAIIFKARVILSCLWMTLYTSPKDPDPIRSPKIYLSCRSAWHFLIMFYLFNLNLASDYRWTAAGLLSHRSLSIYFPNSNLGIIIY